MIPEERFGLVLSDGQVLRTHPRSEYRERREAARLTLSQLVLGISHTKPGGTLLMLLHKVEAWHTARVLQTLSAFAAVRLYKPKSAHRRAGDAMPRSSLGEFGESLVGLGSDVWATQAGALGEYCVLRTWGRGLVSRAAMKGMSELVRYNLRAKGILL